MSYKSTKLSIFGKNSKTEHFGQTTCRQTNLIVGCLPTCEKIKQTISEPAPAVSADLAAGETPEKMNKDIQRANWPEYLRKLGFSDHTVEQCVSKNEVRLNPYWTNLKDEQGRLIIGLEKMVAEEIFTSKRNETVDQILAYNWIKKSVVRNRNQAWFIYNFLRHYPSGDFFKANIVRLKFQLNEDQITQIEHDHEGNINEQRYHMIITWIKAKKLTSVKKIAKALKNLELVSPDNYKPESKAAGSSTNADSCSSDDESDSQSSSESDWKETTSVSDLEKQSLKEFSLKCAKAIADVTNRVPLKATKQENVSEEEFGNTSSWLFKNQNDRKNVTPESLFKEAEHTYDENAKSSHETTNQQQQNVAGLTGIAGIGKTTYCKFVLKHWIESHPHSFVFYISIRDVDFTKSLNLLKFLLVSTDHDYKFKSETDDSILDEINKSSKNTLIVIDGLDEAEIPGDFSKHPHGMSLHEEERAYCILMNLLNCRLLPNAKKLIASRPNAFLNFNPECKPVFMLQVLGLSKESQNLLCKQFSKTEEQQKHVQDELEKQPNVSALLFIPIFARLIISYFVENLESNKSVLSISDVFLNQLEQWQKNPKFHTDWMHLKQLTKLAIYGVENHQFSFPSQDFAKHEIEIKSIEPFMCAHAKNQHGMLVLDGEKTFFFVHTTWQEFLAALYLMVFASYEEFSFKIQQMFQQSSSEMVVRFLFGFCHQKVQEKLKILFSDAQEINRKKKVMKTQARKFLQHLSELPDDIPVTAVQMYEDIIESYPQAHKFKLREKKSTLSNICSWAKEANDDDLTKDVANSLPSPLLLSGDFLPHQVMNICHVLSASEESL